MQQVLDAQRAIPVTLWVTVLALSAALGAALAFGSVAGIGAVLFAVLLLWCVLAWRFGIVALLVLACVDGLIKHVAPATGTYVMKDVVLIATVVGALAWVGANPTHRPAGRWAGFWPWALFVAFLAAQSLAPANGVSTAVAGFRAHALFALLFPLGVIFFDGTRRFVRTADIVVGGIAIAALAGIVQYLMGDAWLRLSKGLASASLHYVAYAADAYRLPGHSGMMYRSYGTLVDPASLGIACAVGFLFAAAGLGRTSFFGRAVLVGAMLVMSLALFLSGTRSAMMATALGMTVLSLLSLSHRSMRVIACLGLATLFLAVPVALRVSHGAVSERVLGQRSAAYAAATREHANKIVIATITEHPFGVGLGAAGAGGFFRTQGQSPALAIDNIYLAYLYEGGVIGVVVFTIVQLSILVLTVSATLHARTDGARATYAGMAAAQTALLAAGFLTQGAFDYAPVAQVFWLFSGAIALPKRVEGLP